MGISTKCWCVVLTVVLLRMVATHAEEGRNFLTPGATFPTGGAEPRGARAPGDCPGDVRFRSRLAAFYPNYDTTEGDEGYLDSRGNKLRTLQDHLDGQVPFVTVALDAGLRINYGTPVCVPELELHFRRVLSLEVRDSGDNLEGSGFQQMDICVRSEPDSYDNAVNRAVTLVFNVPDLIRSEESEKCTTMNDAAVCYKS